MAFDFEVICVALICPAGYSSTFIYNCHAFKVLHAHASTIFLFFNVHAALAMLNHSEYDVDLTVRLSAILDLCSVSLVFGNACA